MIMIVVEEIITKQLPLLVCAVENSSNESVSHLM
jgi:hypothetical protein